MKNLFEAARVTEIKERIAQLRPHSPRLWGSMSPAQALAHCCGGLEIALGDTSPPRMWIGRVLGGFIKPKVLASEAPMRRNSPTMPSLVIQEEKDIAAEQQRLCALIDRFAGAGPQGCTSHPHSFFGPLTPDEWAILMYKHLDHHLRQFNA